MSTLRLCGREHSRQTVEDRSNRVGGQAPAETEEPRNDEESTMETMLQPADHECLPCYLYRCTKTEECDGSLRLLAFYRDHNAPRATALERKVRLLGGYCDCEVLANAIRPITREANQALEDDVDLVCKGVRRGATQPCEHWLMRRGVQWGGGQFRRRSA
ncbi:MULTISPECIES: DUF2695 domain-containing protein [Glutamicibacter]|uniref:DUF2695 domain-containing protein n=1 Tax=Glutamicibacter TaxID=1742989 RepID=UPI00257B6A83|nr:DUF2695 domain-containing protein [Glutamicibacter sp.]